MSEDKPRRLIEVIPSNAPEGYHDRKWFLVEHLLVNAKMDINMVREHLSSIASWPENEEERQIAGDCLSICNEVYVEILAHYAALLSYLSGTDVPERISRMEV